LKKKMRGCSVYLPTEVVELLDFLVKEGHFVNRAEAMRYFITKGAIEYASKVYRS
jgi:Arc/MetJ-type ribon-helix-helix transcriptional regulator